MLPPNLPFRIGTTSYILPDDILPNVRFLADQTQDVQLLLFESAEAAESNLPRETVSELAMLAQAHALSYTVHLPVDLRLGAKGGLGAASQLAAQRAIECTRNLDPWAYIVHLDVRGQLPAPGETAFASELERWQNRAAESLIALAQQAGSANYLAIENLEGVPFEWITPILERVPVCRCVDIGHLWLDGTDPLPHLEQASPRLRVIHLHGIAEHDHMSLQHMDPNRLDQISAWLLPHFSGVVTLEVFSEKDFSTSTTAFAESLQRMAGKEIKREQNG